MMSLESVRKEELIFIKNDERFQKVFKEVPLGMALGTRDLKFVQANVIFCQLLGYSEKELIGCTLAEITHKDDIEKNKKLAKKLYSGQIPILRTKKRYIRKDGETRWAKVTVLPIHDQQDEIKYGLVMLEDITKEALFAERMIQVERLRTVGETTAAISHEFRNSLTSIRMLLELLQESEDIGDSERNSLSVVLKSVGHLENISNQLLEFSRPRSLQFQTSNLNDVVEEAIQLMSTNLNKQKIKVFRSLDNSIELMELDQEGLREVLVNLILNSIESISAKDGKPGPREITISTKKHYLGASLTDFAFPDNEAQNGFDLGSLAKLELELPKDTACTVIEIKDTGAGIGPNYMKQIFEPFFTTKPHGTGLGLANVKRIINSHNGIINVASEIGKGTKFCIYLPILRKE